MKLKQMISVVSFAFLSYCLSISLIAHSAIERARAKNNNQSHSIHTTFTHFYIHLISIHIEYINSRACISIWFRFYVIAKKRERKREERKLVNNSIYMCIQIYYYVLHGFSIHHHRHHYRSFVILFLPMKMQISIVVMMHANLLLFLSLTFFLSFFQ